MKRRTIVGGLASLGLVGAGVYACTPQSARVRFRVIATAEVDGEKIEASSVMERYYARVTGPGSRGGYGESYGESLVLELKGRGTVFIMPIELYNGSQNHIYGIALFEILGIWRGLGSLHDEDFEKLRNANGRYPFKVESGDRLPLFVAFKDEAKPNTVFEVNPKDLAATFGPGVRFIGLEVEFTKAPMTDVLRKRLPWLNKTHPMADKFDRDPPGQIRPVYERPLSYKLANKFFFGTESY
jgi:hypothetical protein